MGRSDLSGPASLRRLGLARSQRPERAGPEPRRGEAGEEAASAAPPPGPRWTAPLLAWGVLSLKFSKRRKHILPLPPLGPVGNFPASLRFLEPRVLTPLERTYLKGDWGGGGSWPGLHCTHTRAFSVGLLLPEVHVKTVVF